MTDFPKEETMMQSREPKVWFYTEPPELEGIEMPESCSYYSGLLGSKAISKPTLLVSAHTHATSSYPISEESLKPPSVLPSYTIESRVVFEGRSSSKLSSHESF